MEEVLDFDFDCRYIVITDLASLNSRIYVCDLPSKYEALVKKYAGPLRNATVSIVPDRLMQIHRVSVSFETDTLFRGYLIGSCILLKQNSLTELSQSTDHVGSTSIHRPHGCMTHFIL